MVVQHLAEGWCIQVVRNFSRAPPHTHHAPVVFLTMYSARVGNTIYGAWLVEQQIAHQDRAAPCCQLLSLPKSQFQTNVANVEKKKIKIKNTATLKRLTQQLMAYVLEHNSCSTHTTTTQQHEIASLLFKPLCAAVVRPLGVLW